GRGGGVGAPGAPGTAGGAPGAPGPGAGTMIAGPVAAEPGGGVTAPGAGGGADVDATAPPASHAARMRNCSLLSRPRVTGEENSTRCRRGEVSSHARR